MVHALLISFKTAVLLLCRLKSGTPATRWKALGTFLVVFLFHCFFSAFPLWWRTGLHNKRSEDLFSIWQVNWLSDYSERVLKEWMLSCYLKLFITRGMIGQCPIIHCCLFPYFLTSKVFHWFRFLIPYQCNISQDLISLFQQLVYHQSKSPIAYINLH